MADNTNRGTDQKATVKNVVDPVGARAQMTNTEENRDAVANDPVLKASQESNEVDQEESDRINNQTIIDPHGHTRENREDVKTAPSSGGLPYNDDPEAAGLPGPITGHAVNTDGSEEAVIDTRLKFWRKRAGEGAWIDMRDAEKVAAARREQNIGDQKP